MRLWDAARGNTKLSPSFYLVLDVINVETLPPSNTARNARIRKGAVFPTNSYITLPNGGPTVEDKLVSGADGTVAAVLTHCSGGHMSVEQLWKKSHVGG